MPGGRCVFDLSKLCPNPTTCLHKGCQLFPKKCGDMTQKEADRISSEHKTKRRIKRER